MVRLERIGVLLAITVLLSVVAGFTLPARLDGPAEETPPGERCDYAYVTVNFGTIDAEDRETAIPYDELSDVRKEPFDRVIETNEPSVSINQSVWQALYNKPNRTHYIADGETLYRARPNLNGCSLWEAFANASE